MKWLNGYRMRLVLVGVVAAIVFGGGSAKADFTFGEPTKLGSTVNSPSHYDGPAYISVDGLEFYFSSTRPGGHGTEDIWVTRRLTKDDPWGEPVNLGPHINSSGCEWGLSMSPDGQTLYFDSERPGGYGGSDIWMATRQSKHDNWGTPVNLGSLVNSPTHDCCPSISSDGLELYFSDWAPPGVNTRPGGYGWSDIWVSTRPTKEAPWGEPENLGPLVNGPSEDVTPYLSKDGLLLFLTSQREGRPPYGELYMTRRSARSEPWGEPVNLGPIINTTTDFEECPVISADGSSLFFDVIIVSTGSWESCDIWQAPIIPIVDFNGDGVVDAADMCIMVDYWGTDNSLCDIGPMPWGDGIVDVEDLIVLAEHLFEEIFSPELVAYWKLDEVEGDVAYNSVSDDHGTLSGNPTWQPDDGMVAGALQFDGIDDYISTDFVLNPADGSFSVFVWIKGGAPDQVIVSQEGGVSWLMADIVDGALRTNLRTPATGGRDPQPPGPPLICTTVVTDGNWHRVGFVRDGNDRILYVDDIEVARDTAETLESSEGGLYIGAESGLEPGTLFSGLIDDVRIYNRAVNP